MTTPAGPRPRSVKTRRKFADLQLGALSTEIEAALGRPVSLLVDVTADGDAVVTVVDPSAGDQGVEIPEAQLLALVDAHQKPAPEPDDVDVLDALIASLTAARTIADVRDALLTYSGAERTRRARNRVRAVRPEGSPK